MRLHHEFEWDEDKAAANFKKHSVSFDDAARVLADEEGDLFHIEEYDEQHRQGEDRYITTASHPEDHRMVLRIAWTERADPHQERPITRLFSASGDGPREKDLCQRNPPTLSSSGHPRRMFPRHRPRIWPVSAPPRMV